MRNRDHEDACMTAFFLPGRQRRARAQCASRRKRAQFLNRLSRLGCDYIDERYVIALPHNQHNPEALYTRLKSLGAPKTCYVISQDHDIDCREMALRDALITIVGAGKGTILSCIPGILAYYEPGKGSSRFLLHRPQENTYMETYTVKQVPNTSAICGTWDRAFWQRADTVSLTHFRPESSDHRPHTQIRLIYNGDGICGMFRVEDQYVKCIHTRYMDPVYTDSCVEFFVKPKRECGYFNFEFSCGGALLASYIVNPTRTPDGFENFTPLPEADGALVTVSHSLPPTVDPEITSPTTWFLGFVIPFTLLEKYIGPLGEVKGQQWRANFYKCGDNTSHPHWASWSPVTALNFHLPDCFGEIYFE